MGKKVVRVFIVILFLIIRPVSILSEDCKKLGLALSGGGALGFAHIGVIEVLDSLGIKADYVTGTSMGGIVGGLYAIGYTGREIENLALSIDWLKIFEDKIPRNRLPYFLKRNEGRYHLEFGIENFRPVTKGGLIAGQNIYMTLARLTFPYEYVGDFDKLPIPFRCISVDLITGKEVVHKSGSLAKAIRATMAVPTIFSPVVWGDSLLIDGGLVNNFPADVAKEMGADIVIGVFVFMPMKEIDDIKNTIDVLAQSYTIARNNSMSRNLKYADILIEVPLKGYTPFDFEIGRIKDIIKIGKIAAYKNLDKLIKLKNSDYKRIHDESGLNIPDDKMVIANISIIGRMSISFERLKDIMNISPGDTIDIADLESIIARLKALKEVKSVKYKIRQLADGRVHLELVIEDISPPEISHIEITGCKSFSENFIKRIMGINIGELLDVDKLSEKIERLYSFGYFENITYEIIPQHENKVVLRVNIKEKYLNKVRTGIHLDNRYNLIGLIGYENLSFLFPGVRLDGELIAMGYTQFRLNISCPSRSMDMPFYPYFNTWSLNKPYFIYDNEGIKKASFIDKSKGIDFGFGLLLKNMLNITFDFGSEYQIFKLDIGSIDSLLFPYTKKSLNNLTLRIEFDNLNDSFHPMIGMKMKLEMSDAFKNNPVNYEYRYILSSVDYYNTVGSNTFRAMIFAGFGDKLPICRFFRFGGRKDFIGADYDQLTLSDVVFFRFDYGYNITKIFRPYVSISYAPYYRFDYKKQAVNGGNNLLGFGAGLLIFTPLGPIDLVLSNGEKNIYHKGHRAFYFYFSAGIVL